MHAKTLEKLVRAAANKPNAKENAAKRANKRAANRICAKIPALIASGKKRSAKSVEVMTVDRGEHGAPPWNGGAIQTIDPRTLTGVARIVYQTCQDAKLSPVVQFHVDISDNSDPQHRCTLDLQLP